MKLSAVMIARDEQANVDRCFSSLWSACDELVLCDTGSTDGTIAKARAFAERRGEPDKLIVGHFAWRDDWAAARNHADSLATGDWLLNIDLDQTLERAWILSNLIRTAPPALIAVAFHQVDEHTQRPALARVLGIPATIHLVRSGFPWQGRVGEHRVLPADACIGREIGQLPADHRCRLVHHRVEHSYPGMREEVDRLRRGARDWIVPAGCLGRPRQ